eukprot:Gb_14748 [translate_table: standard]
MTPGFSWLLAISMWQPLDQKDNIVQLFLILDKHKLFTEAMRRLADYMKLCYKVFYDIVHEVAWELEKEQGHELLGFFREAAEKARGELASSIKCYMKDHPRSIEEEALKHFYARLDPTITELTF